MSGFPLYLNLQKDIMDAIASGEYGPGDMLPTEQELCGSYGISRATVRKALDNLCADGRVVRRHGVGTFVQAWQPPSQSARFRGYLDDVLINDPENRFCRIRTRRCKFADEIRELFGGDGVEDGSVSLSTLHHRKNPIMAGEIYLPSRIADYDTATAYETSQQPTLVIFRRAGIAVGRSWQKVRAVTADREIARLLEVPVKAPLVGVDRVYCDTLGRAVAVVKGIYHPNNYEMQIDLLPRTEGRFT